MLGISKVIAAIRKKLNTKFPDIPVQTQDVEEGFKRPSFFIEMSSMKTQDFMRRIKESNITFNIIYFPTHPKRNQLELLQKIDELDEIFIEDNVLELEYDFLAEIEETSQKIIDRILHYSFNIYLSEEYLRKAVEIEMMEDLKLEYKRTGDEKEEIDANN